MSEAYGKLKNGDLDAAILDWSSLAFGWKNGHYCDLHIVEHIYTRSCAFALKKGSPWNEAISTLMRNYKLNGVMNHLRSQHMSPKCTEKEINQPKNFDILYLSGPCIMLVLGVILGATFLVIERIIDARVTRFEPNQTLRKQRSSDNTLKGIKAEDLARTTGTSDKC